MRAAADPGLRRDGQCDSAPTLTSPSLNPFPSSLIPSVLFVLLLLRPSFPRPSRLALLASVFCRVWHRLPLLTHPASPCCADLGVAGNSQAPFPSASCAPLCRADPSTPVRPIAHFHILYLAHILRLFFPLSPFASFRPPFYSFSSSSASVSPRPLSYANVK